MSPDRNFERYVESLIVREVESGVLSWNELLRRLPGVTPDVALNMLRRRNLDDRMDFNEPEGNPNGALSAFRFWREGYLPTPHILDSCWWFSDTSLSLLRMRVAKHPRARVVLLGTPALFHFLGSGGSEISSLTLLDSDAALKQSPANFGRLIVADVLHDELPRFAADLVIADPPWYEKELCAFLWAARRFCAANGTVLISVPPEATRPGIRDEWERVLEWAHRLGLSLVDYERGCLSYLSPPFERNAFASAGTGGVHIDWRRGNLATFICSGPITSGRPTSVIRQPWADYIVDGVRIRLRGSAEESGLVSPELSRLVSGDILPSVSRRHPLLQLIDLWTSGNRVFRCQGRFLTGLMLGALECGRDPVSHVQGILGSLSADLQSAVSDVRSTLCEIVALEKSENQTFWQRYERQLDPSAN